MLITSNGQLKSSSKRTQSETSRLSTRRAVHFAVLQKNLLQLHWWVSDQRPNQPKVCYFCIIAIKPGLTQPGDVSHHTVRRLCTGTTSERELLSWTNPTRVMRGKWSTQLQRKQCALQMTTAAQAVRLANDHCSQKKYTSKLPHFWRPHSLKHKTMTSLVPKTERQEWSRSKREHSCLVLSSLVPKLVYRIACKYLRFRVLEIYPNFG